MPAPKELDPEASAAARFGYELRKAREAAALTQGQLGDRMGYHANAVGMIERGERVAKAEFARAAGEALGLEPDELVKHLPISRRETIFKTLVPWLEIEASARELWTWEPTIVPGLLQTPEYARAIVEQKPGIVPEQIEEAVRDRMARKEIFHRTYPPQLYAVLDESILYRPIGSETVTRNQLAHLIEVAHGPITIQILPFSARVTAGLLGGCLIAHMAGRPAAAFVDSPVNGKVWDRESEVEILIRRYQACRSEALPQSLSLRKIEERLDQEWNCS
ncbi:helix-turn-helix domain-containing protein [Nonomuraea jiangxiensis]|uniref:Helix-turn-helix domain-containing protein n=1 Tax=Nonomuraea jiangxiensis TaxID=633440 RepID=A0A1G8ZGA1_9ACTN|nr:helix-turn-helix transcriptional regulator [Nonomuraea jiangxiensis]SDK14129.1 Helix-turn-helix domain-containing protein [Nonomuraea jiangxiensis]